MKVYNILYIIVFLLMISSVKAWSTNQLYNSYLGSCYQETANISNLCGGLSTGTYSYSGDGFFISNMIDGVWFISGLLSTNSGGTLYINYSTPLNADNTSFWQVKFFNYQTNITIPNCFNNYPGKISLKVNSSNGTDYGYAYCLNGITGKWDYLTKGISPDSRLYEESMTWNLSNAQPLTNETINSQSVRFLNIPMNVRLLTNTSIKLLGSNYGYASVSLFGSLVSGGWTNQNNANDGNWGTFAQFNGGTGSYLYENFTISSNSYTNVIVTANYTSDTLIPNQLRAFNYSSGTFDFIDQHDNSKSTDVYNLTSIDPSFYRLNGINKSVIQLAFYHQVVLFGAYVSEAQINYTGQTNLNTTVSINTANYSLTTPTLTNITDSKLKNDINYYILNNCAIGTSCQIPLLFVFQNISSLNYSGLYFDNDFFENSQNYNNQTIAFSNENFNINMTYDSSFYNGISVSLVYNNSRYTASSSSIGDNKLFSRTISVPIVNQNTNYTFYWEFILSNGTGPSYYNSTFNNQTVQPLNISINCGLGTFPFMNISNYDEETLKPMNATIEYLISFINTNTVLNGYLNGTNISFCTQYNTSTTNLLYNLQLRYYAPGYDYKTYNTQNGNMANLPLSIPLYYINNTLGTQFDINYIDFNYIQHPNALIQIQRQYLSNGNYIIVELPLISSDGGTTGTFNTNNVRYKLIVIDNGNIIDTFNNVYPTCQSIVLGQCALNLRGAKTTSSNSAQDFTYTLLNQNNNLILTYIIPSGTPSTVTFLTNQNSRFLSGISSCNQSIYGSGGTITCSYNNTVGDSIINTEIDVNNNPILYGNIPVSENLNGLFLGNNYFIAFILLLTLILIYVTSGIISLVIIAFGVLYLGFIFLIQGGSVGLMVGSFGWLVIAIIIVIYHLAQREEKLP